MLWEIGGRGGGGGLVIVCVAAHSILVIPSHCLGPGGQVLGNGEMGRWEMDDGRARRRVGAVRGGLGGGDRLGWVGLG